MLLFRYRERYPAKHAAIVTAPALMAHAHDGAAVAEVAIAPPGGGAGVSRMPFGFPE